MTTTISIETEKYSFERVFQNLTEVELRDMTDSFMAALAEKNRVQENYDFYRVKLIETFFTTTSISKIEAIKEWRSITGCGIKEAKDFMESAPGTIFDYTFVEENRSWYDVQNRMSKYVLLGRAK